MAEQLGFEEVGGEGGDVDGEERSVPPGAVLVERPREDLLPGAALAAKDDGRVGGRDPRRANEERLHHGAFGDQPRTATEARRVRAEAACGAGVRVPLEGRFAGPWRGGARSIAFHDETYRGVPWGTSPWNRRGAVGSRIRAPVRGGRARCSRGGCARGAHAPGPRVRATAPSTCCRRPPARCSRRSARASGAAGRPLSCSSRMA